MDINIFAHLFQKCEDTLDLALGVLYTALCLIDVIQNCPVCKEAVKEEICKFQKAVHRNLKVCGDLNISKLSFEPPQFHLKLFDLFLRSSGQDEEDDFSQQGWSNDAEDNRKGLAS